MRTQKSNNTGIIIGALLLLWWFFFRKKESASPVLTVSRGKDSTTYNGGDFGGGGSSGGGGSTNSWLASAAPLSSGGATSVMEEKKKSGLDVIADAVNSVIDTVVPVAKSDTPFIEDDISRQLQSIAQVTTVAPPDVNFGPAAGVGNVGEPQISMPVIPILEYIPLQPEPDPIRVAPIQLVENPIYIPDTVSAPYYQPVAIESVREIAIPPYMPSREVPPFTPPEPVYYGGGGTYEYADPGGDEAVIREDRNELQDY